MKNHETKLSHNFKIIIEETHMINFAGRQFNIYLTLLWTLFKQLKMKWKIIVN